MRGGRSWAWEKPGRRTWPGPTWRGRGLAALPRAPGLPGCAALLGVLRGQASAAPGVRDPLTSGAREPAGSRPPLRAREPRTGLPGGPAPPPPGLAYLCPPPPDTAGSAPPPAVSLSLVNSSRFSPGGSHLEVIEMAPAPPPPPRAHFLLPAQAFVRGPTPGGGVPAGRSPHLRRPSRPSRSRGGTGKGPPDDSGLRWVPNPPPRPGAEPGLDSAPVTPPCSGRRLLRPQLGGRLVLVWTPPSPATKGTGSSADSVGRNAQLGRLGIPSPGRCRCRRSSCHLPAGVFHRC